LSEELASAEQLIEREVEDVAGEVDGVREPGGGGKLPTCEADVVCTDDTGGGAEL
jgi:hypothetical protein